jgi:hypothetical protein
MPTKQTKKQVCLGQVAFVVNRVDGEIERTMVGAIDEHGYHFLDGSSDSRPHWFDYDQAVVVVDERLKSREKKLLKELQALGRRRKILKSEENKGTVMRSTLKVTELRMLEKRTRSRRLRRVKVPEQHLHPGNSVYVIITPKIGSLQEEVYRPYTHFVLETKISTVCFSPDGEVHYTFTTPFDVIKYFLEKDQAIRELENLSEPVIHAGVPVVTHKEEKEKLAETENIPV